MHLLRHYSLVYAEVGVMLVAVVALIVRPQFFNYASHSVWKLSLRVSRAPRLAWAVALCAPIALRLLALPVAKIPEPGVQDEFSFLLLADTFTSGRLTNPTHPMWIHFETIHIIQQPTYASIYPVMQGLFLALGQALTHTPWLGVWFSVVLMGGAIYWALKGWMPPVWALGGTILAAIRIAMFSYWMNSFWGGAPAAIGGALVLGALPRVCRFRRAEDSLLLGIGMATLANSRPYEGFFFCLPVGFLILTWLAGARKLPHWFGISPRNGISFRSALLRVIMPGTLVLVLAGAAMMYYFWRVTGNPLKMPYSAEQYSITPLFVWQKLRPEPHYDGEDLRYFYTNWNVKRPSEVGRFARCWVFYLGPCLTAPLLLVPLVLRDRKIRLFLLLGVFTALGLAIEWWANPHYAAPVTATLYATILQCLRHWRAMAARFPVHSPWRASAVLVPAVVFAMVGVRFAMPLLSITPMPIYPAVWAAGGYAKNTRLLIENFLNRQPGKHLVMVRYFGHESDISTLDEWIYNRANIDASKIVWSRELDEEHNRKLLTYFKDRKVWLCNPKDRKLTPLN